VRFACGIERVLLAMQAAGASAALGPDAFVVTAGSRRSSRPGRSPSIARSAGTWSLGAGGSFKSQMKKADRERGPLRRHHRRRRGGRARRSR
jgi:hypothetical protein